MEMNFKSAAAVSGNLERRDKQQFQIFGAEILQWKREAIELFDW